HDPVWRSAGRTLEPHLPIDRICTEEPQVHPSIASSYGRVVHRLRPVFVVADREEASIVQQPGSIAVGINIGRVAEVVPRPLDPAYEVDLPVEEIAIAVAGVGAIERDLRCLRASSHRRGSVAVEPVQTLPRAAVTWVVVVSLVCIDRLLVEQGRDTIVVAA